MEMGESTHVTTQGNNKNHSNHANQKGKEKMSPKAAIKKESVCFLCKKKEHIQKDCTKYKKQLEKKGNSISFVYYESNMTDVNHNT